jgi:hypothetical protein
MGRGSGGGGRSRGGAINAQIGRSQNVLSFASAGNQSLLKRASDADILGAFGELARGNAPKTFGGFNESRARSALNREANRRGL